MEGEKYNLEKAQEEAKELHKRLSSVHGNKDSFTREEYAREHEVMEVDRGLEMPLSYTKEMTLSKELKEKILAKVKDIRAYGTAYTWILDSKDYRVLSHIFQTGVVGLPRENRIDEKGRPKIVSPGDKLKAFKKGLRDGKQTSVSFNIMGRSFRPETFFRAMGHHGEEKEGKDAYKEDADWAGNWEFGYNWVSPAGIVFDISQFKEEPPQLSGQLDYREPLEIGKYNIRTEDEYVDPTPNEHGDLVTTSEYGFSLHSRIAPDQFQGVVVGNKETISELLHIWNSSPEQALPIYNMNGDLIWPEKIPYSEINQEFKAKIEKELKEKK